MTQPKLERFFYAHRCSWVFDLVVQHLIVYYITEHACTSVSVLQRGKVYLTQTLIYDLVCVSADKVQVL